MEHGMTYLKVQDLYDSWTEEGGNQSDLYTKVILPTLSVSGFTADQAETLMEKLGTSD